MEDAVIFFLKGGTMRDLINYVFDKYKKDNVWYDTVNIDERLAAFITKFCEEAELHDASEVAKSIINDIHVLQYIDSNKNHFVGLYSFYGESLYFVSKDLITRIEDNTEAGAVFYIERLEKDDVSGKKLPIEYPAFFVFRDTKRHARCLVLQQMTFSDTEHAVKIAYLNGDLIINTNEGNLYLLNESLSAKTFVNVSKDIKDILAKNNLVYNTTEDDILSIKPIRNDIFEVKIGLSKTFLYSTKYKDFTMSLDGDYLIVNAIHDIEIGVGIIYHMQRIKTSEIDENGEPKYTYSHSIKLMSLNMNKPNAINFDLPEVHTIILNRIYGTDIFYSVTQDPMNPNAVGMSQMNIFDIDKYGNLDIKVIKMKSAPNRISYSEETGVLTVQYSVDNYYNILNYMYQGNDLYKYSYVEIDPVGDVDKFIENYAKHTKTIEANKFLSNDEIDNLHRFNKSLYPYEKEVGLYVATSSQFVNLETNEIEYDILRINTTPSGKFIETTLSDKSTRVNMRIRTAQDPDIMFETEYDDTVQLLQEMNIDINK